MHLSFLRRQHNFILLIIITANLKYYIKFTQKLAIFQPMGMTEMATMLNQHSLGNDCNDSEPILQPQPDQTDTIDGESFFFCYIQTTTNLKKNLRSVF